MGPWIDGRIYVLYVQQYICRYGDVLHRTDGGLLKVFIMGRAIVHTHVRSTGVYVYITSRLMRMWMKLRLRWWCCREGGECDDTRDYGGSNSLYEVEVPHSRKLGKELSYFRPRSARLRSLYEGLILCSRRIALFYLPISS